MSLVLRRRVGEDILIGDDIVVGIVEIRKSEQGGYSVALSITAPREVPVHRREIYDAIKQEQKLRRVSCSSCGCDFISEHGFSHCDNHAGLKEIE